jgi:hypothetical protein
MFLESLLILGRKTLKSLRFLGVYEIYGEYSPLIDPRHEEAVIPMFVSFCSSKLREGRCDVISFHRFPESSHLMITLSRELRSRGFLVQYTPNSVPRVVMDLPRDWETFLKSLPAKDRQILGRRLRSLKKHGVEVECMKDPLACAAAFDDFVELHGKSWSRKSVRGYFASSERFEKFHRTVMRDLRPEGRARLYFLKKDGVRIAAVQAFFVHDECCFYLSGFDSDHELANFSPGKILLSLVIKDAIEEGYKRFDFQGGNDEYKMHLGGKQTAFSKTLVMRPNLGTVKVGIIMSIDKMGRILRDDFWEGQVIRLTQHVFHGQRLAKSKM